MGDLNRKEEAIRWLTQELRSLRLAPDINGCDMQPHWQEQIDILEICLEAVRACHIGDTSKMVPLTQADIETMHFERVWIDYGEDREDGVVLYGRLYSIDTLDGAGFEDLLLAATGHGGENIDRSSGEYTIYRCQPGSRTGYGDGMVPLTLEQLREMDGQPVWIVEQPDWGHWELSEDADDYFSDRDPGLYGLTYPDPEGKGGIHKLGWIAYAYPPPQAETAEARLAKTGSGKEINMASLKRLTDRQINSSDRYYMNCSKTCIFKFDCQETCDCEELDQLIDRLGQIEDILGDDYDLDRLRELVAADR